MASTLSACVVLWFRSAACWSSTWAAAWRSTRSSWIRRCCWSWANWTKPRSSLTTSTWLEPYWLHHPHLKAIVCFVFIVVLSCLVGYTTSPGCEQICPRGTFNKILNLESWIMLVCRGASVSLMFVQRDASLTWKANMFHHNRSSGRLFSFFTGIRVERLQPRRTTRLWVSKWFHSERSVFTYNGKDSVLHDSLPSLIVRFGSWSNSPNYLMKAKPTQLTGV